MTWGSLERRGLLAPTDRPVGAENAGFIAGKPIYNAFQPARLRVDNQIGSAAICWFLAVLQVDSKRLCLPAQNQCRLAQDRCNMPELKTKRLGLS